MCQQEDKCNLLLSKLMNLDQELLALLKKNDIENLVFCKIDNTLYRTLYTTTNKIVCWYGYEKNIQKFIRAYYNNTPIDIYLYIDEITKQIFEIEFLDWTNTICHIEDNCIDLILNLEIKIIQENLPPYF